MLITNNQNLNNTPEQDLLEFDFTEVDNCDISNHVIYHLGVI